MTGYTRNSGATVFFWGVAFSLRNELLTNNLLNIESVENMRLNNKFHMSS